MAHKHLTYLDIPANHRRLTAGKNLTRLKESLGNPALTPEQRETILARIEHVTKWAAGTLHENAQKPDTSFQEPKPKPKADPPVPETDPKPKKSEPKGKNHEVGVSEDVKVSEG
jgi:hypothetical protein